MLKLCWIEGRRLVSLLSLTVWPCVVLTSSGAGVAIQSHYEHLPLSLQRHSHSRLLSLPPFLFPDLWPLLLYSLSIQTQFPCNRCISSLLVLPLPPVLIFFFLPFQIVICGQRDSPDTASLLATVNSLFQPHKVSVLSSDASCWRMCVSSSGRAALKSKDHRAAVLHALIY